MRKSVTKVVFPVAGLGTRFLPVTKAVPKEMLPVLERPLIQYAVEEAVEAGITDFIFVTNAQNRPILEAYFGENEALNAVLAQRGRDVELKALGETHIASQHLHFCTQDEPLGLGHAVWCARDFVADEPFCVILPDDLIQTRPGCLKQMMDMYKDKGGNVVAVEDVARAITDRYGILDVSEDDGRIVRARGLVEKPVPHEAPSTVSIVGRYILDGSVFAYLDRHMAGAGGEIQLTDALSATLAKEAYGVAFHGVRFGGRRFDCGSMAGFVEANVAFALACSRHGRDVRERLERLL